MSMRAHSWIGVLSVAALSLTGAHPAPPIGDIRQHWTPVARGLERMTVDVAGGGEGWNTRIVALRLDPAMFHFALRTRMDDEGAPAWSVSEAPARAIVAVNAGQFSGVAPWGWVVIDGQEVQPPGRGPLSTAVMWDRSGRIRWLRPGAIDAERARGTVREAFQSYPTLLDDRGEAPAEIREPGVVDVAHRDSRLAIGALDDGRLLLAITRFNGFGPISPAVPLGLTLSEMAEVMRGLGCRRAVALDGGVSAQLMVRDRGRTEIWRGWRKVPLGLVVEPGDHLN
jgi:exopolysaccharide biosynthesis protein